MLTAIVALLKLAALVFPFILVWFVIHSIFKEPDRSSIDELIDEYTSLIDSYTNELLGKHNLDITAKTTTPHIFCILCRDELIDNLYHCECGMTSHSECLEELNNNACPEAGCNLKVLC